MQCVSSRSCTQCSLTQGSGSPPVILISYPEPHGHNILRGAVPPISVITVLGDTHMMKAARTAISTAFHEIISNATI
ncbi:hypothetical protein E2C01_019374 [Portunus trituberculatus]|uniref:Uncharacterized protein n=1 Tax=Portunus trituberculatus TaxID=210409 RepID=A0A5B7DYP8_PORTR|nr:hypothetical protein [Portunus trituberculatus]